MAFIDIDVTKNITTIDCWMQGEKNAEGVHFDISTWIETYGAGTAYIYIRRNGDETAYFRAMEVTDGVAEWLFSAADTAKAGDGRAQAVYITTDESVVKKTNWYHTVTAESEGDPTGEDPDPYKEMATEVIARMEEAEEELTEEALGEISDAKDAALEDIQDTMFNLAPEFVTTASYSAGDIVLYIGNLYEFTADHAAGAWIGTDARQTTIGGVVADLKEDIADRNNWTVGSAEQIVSDEASASDVTPYTFRRSGGGLIPFNFTREELAKVVGGTVAWNQLANIGGTETISGITFTKDNGSYVLSGTASGLASKAWMTATNVYEEHKYLLTGGVSQNVYCVLTNVSVWNTTERYDYGTGSIARCLGNGTATGYAQVLSGTTVNNVKVTPQLTDLTAMLGTTIADYIYSLETATAGSGIAKLKEWGFFRDSYYSYDAGSLQSVCVSEHDTVGFNVWDEVWRVGSIDTGTGEDISITNLIRCENHIPVISGATYYHTGRLQLYFYDGKKEYISYSPFANEGTFVVPTNAEYIRFAVSSNYGTTYKNDICINLSKTTGTPKNGDYVPYEKHTYALDSDLVLRGLPKLDSNNKLYYDGDTYASDGTVTRKWTEYTPTTAFNKNAITTISTTEDYTTFWLLISPKNGQIICNRVPWVPYSQVSATVPSISVSPNYPASARLTMPSSVVGTTRDSIWDYITSGDITFLYELATPTTETADLYTAVQICDSDGTEEFVDALVEAGTRDVAIPAGTETVYYEDMAGKLAELPPIPSAPSADGTYTLQAVVSSGAVTYQWTS